MSSLEDRMGLLERQSASAHALLLDSHRRLERLERVLFPVGVPPATAGAPVPGIRPGTGATEPYPPASASISPGAAPPGGQGRSTIPAPAENDLESLVGGHLLSRVAAVALVLGLAFYLKLAVNHGWVTPGLRILFGSLLGAGLVGLGEWVRRRGLIVYSYGLTGAGFAALYVTVYAAYGFFGMIGFLPAFLLMAAVSAATVVRAVRVDAEVIAALGLLSGFLTPIILRNPDGLGRSLISLFSYLWIVDAGVLAAAWIRDWKHLRLASLIVTELFFAGWLLSYNPGPVLLPLLGAATAFLLLFVAVAAAPVLAGRRQVNIRDLALIWLNPTGYALLVVALAFPRWPTATGLYLIGLSIFYAGLLIAARRIAGWDSALPTSFLVVSAGCLTLSLGLLFTGSTRLLGWDAEAVVLLWGGCALESGAFRRTGYFVYGLMTTALVLTLAIFLVGEGGFSPGRPELLASVELPCLLALLSAVAGELIVRKYSDRLPGEAAVAGSVLGILAASVWLVWLTIEVIGRASSEISAWLSASWTVSAALITLCGEMGGRQALRSLGRAIICLALAKLILVDAAQTLPRLFDASPIWSWGFDWRTDLLPYLFVIAGAVLGERACHIRDDEGEDGTARVAYGSAACLAVVIWLTNAALAQGGTGPGVAAWISVTWSVCAAVLLAIGIAVRQKLYRLWGLGLFAAVVAKVFLHDIWSLDYRYRVVSLFSLAAALWLTSYLYARYRDRLRELIRGEPRAAKSSGEYPH